METQVELPFSFDTFRLKGFIPTWTADLNADGFPDFVSSGGGKKVEVFLGGGKNLLEKKSHSQKMSTAGVIHFGDIDSDGLQDFVLFDPHNFDVPVKLGRNRGQLPGTPPALRSND
jgi:hypothetical protein